MWDVRDVGYSGCGMLSMENVENMGFWGYGMLELWDDGDVGYSGCAVLWIWNVWAVGCLGCGMLEMSMFGM